jgi:prepilin-type N-terminal cleavage/methylation domain-containing protein
MGRPLATGERRFPRSRSRCSTRQAGFTLVWVMAVLVVLAIGLSAVGTQWADQAQRERERELLRIGAIYAQAIADYHAASPGSHKHYPASLHDLLEDRRFIGIRRHLRQLYPDPVNPGQDWGLVPAPGGGVLGVYSRSTATPLRREPQDLGVTVLPRAQHYSDWQFVPRAIP